MFEASTFHKGSVFYLGEDYKGFPWHVCTRRKFNLQEVTLAILGFLQQKYKFRLNVILLAKYDGANWLIGNNDKFAIETDNVHASSLDVDTPENEAEEIAEYLNRYFSFVPINDNQLELFI